MTVDMLLGIAVILTDLAIICLWWSLRNTKEITAVIGPPGPKGNTGTPGECQGDCCKGYAP